MQEQEPPAFSKDSLQSRSLFPYFSTGSWDWVLESQSHMLCEQKACHSQLVNAKPLCRASKKCHVHALVILAAEGSASTTQASTQLFLPLPMPPPQACSCLPPSALPWCPIPKTKHWVHWGLSVLQGKTSEPAHSPGALHFVFAHPALIRSLFLPRFPPQHG